MAKVRIEHFEALEYGDRVPRKVKKAILGKRIGRQNLHQRLANIVVGPMVKTMYESPNISDEFCPKCGCRARYSDGNNAEYPDHWERFYCLRCGHQVGVIDNSPFIHALMYRDNNYEIDF